MGESGSGKSVTCLSLVRLVPEPAGRIVGGRVLLDGEDLLDKSAAEMRRVRGKQIAMVLQDPMTSLNPALTIGTQVSEVVRLHQGLRGAAAARARAGRALPPAHPGRGQRGSRHYQHQLSGGMRQRVSSAIALSCAPRLLIADEPTTSLDVTIQAQYLDLLKEVQAATGVAVILVTHDFGIVAANADRVAVMYAGRIVEIGTTLEVFNHPAHPYTRALLRCLPDVELKHRAAGRDRRATAGPDAAAAGLSRSRRAALSGNRSCETEYPPAVSVQNGHVAHCWVALGSEAPAAMILQGVGPEEVLPRAARLRDRPTARRRSRRSTG